MEYRFEITMNGKKIQSGRIEADTPRIAYERFIYACLDKIEEPSKSGSKVVDDIFNILNIKQK